MENVPHQNFDFVNERLSSSRLNCILSITNEEIVGEVNRGVCAWVPKRVCIIEKQEDEKGKVLRGVTGEKEDRYGE